MPIRPIDFQVMIPKTVDVSRIQANEQHSVHAALQSKLQSVEKQSEQNMRQVNNQKEVSEIYIRDNNERNNKERKQNSENSREKLNKEKNSKSKPYGGKMPCSTIDIRL
jgi:hypothetical protein